MGISFSGALPKGKAGRSMFTWSVGRAGTVPNRNYISGRSREYRAMSALKRDGWMVSRSAASHGAVDVFAAKDGRVLLVQVKSGRARATREELQELAAWGKNADGDAEVWYYKGRGKVVKRRVHASKKGNA
jgi:Holliday junction resolvase